METAVYMKKCHTGELEEDEFFSGDDEATAAAARELESSRAAAREENEVKEGKRPRGSGIYRHGNFVR